MTAHVKSKHRFEHAAERLVEALTDPDFHDAKVRYVGERGSKLVSLERTSDDSLLVVTRQRIDRDDLPGLARRFSGGDVYADRSERWSLSSIWSSGEFTVDVPGAPMRSGGKMSLVSDGDDACTLSVRTFISVSAPLVSRGIERGMADNVRDWLDEEAEFTGRWLDGARPTG